MAVLSATFKIIDEMSSIFDRIANSGAVAMKQWEDVGSITNRAFSQATSGADNFAKAIQTATAVTDYWTDALGSYDKGAMEAVFSTEELVNMGYKTEDALEAATAAITEEISAIESGIRIAEEFNSAISEQERELEQLQTAYIGVAMSLGQNSDEAITLKSDIDSLSKILDQNREEWEDLEKASGKTGEESASAIETIEQALVAAGLTKLLSEVTDIVIEMTNAFSEAESVVAKATGATGTQLDSLSASMMKVYAAVDDADMTNTAAAIGEINTRLGLQGVELENVAGLFMMYADNTNSGVVPAIQDITKVMKNWGIEIYETESLLDKFTYASQASGASVDMLSNMVIQNKATMQQLGYGLDESIALLSMFEYEGLNASSIMMGFRSAVTGFSADGRDASTAMQEVIEQIGNMASESDATALAIETFGSRAGGELAYAIRNGKFEIEEWVAAIEGAEGTLAKTDDAADTLADKWTVASNSMSTAFTSVIEPVTSGISETFAGLVGEIGSFLNKHPVVTAAIVGIATALGIATAGVAAISGALAIKAAILPVVTLLTRTFGVTLSEAIWPITLIVAGVAALVAGITLLIGWLDKTNEEYNTLTATSKQHYDQLEQLNTEYDEACKKYGETSREALTLRYEVDELSSAFEANKKTVEEFENECDALIEAHDKLVSSYEKNIANIRAEELGSLALINKLEMLGSQTTKTAGTQAQMQTIIEKLNESIPELALSYEQITTSVEASVEAYRKAAEAQAEQSRYQEQQRTYVEALAEQENLANKLAEAEANLNAERKRHGMYLEERTGRWKNNTYYEDSLWADWTTNLDSYADKFAVLQKKQAENNATIAECEDGYRKMSEAAEKAANATITYEEAVSRSIQSVSSDINDLIAAYDEAYEAAYKSIEGTIGLFDTMATESKLSTDDMREAMQSQIAYLEIYMDNLKKASKYKLDDELIASLNDGSKESAGYIDAIIKEIELLGGTTEGLTENAAIFIQNFNNQFREVETAKDEFAATVAEMETDFSSKMQEIETSLIEAIDKMNMEADAKAAAKDTMQAYISQIQSMTSEAHSAAEAVAMAVNDALSTSYKSSIAISAVSEGRTLLPLDNYTQVPMYASGTVNAPDVFIAGEEGPELIVGAEGSTVFPAEETERILAASSNVPVFATAGFDTSSLYDDILAKWSESPTGALTDTAGAAVFPTEETNRIFAASDVPFSVTPLSGFELQNGGSSGFVVEHKHTHTFNINGNGEIRVDGSVDENTIVDLMAENMKPILLSILRKEQFEEGDLSYVF